MAARHSLTRLVRVKDKPTSRGELTQLNPTTAPVFGPDARQAPGPQTITLLGKQR